MFALAVEKMRAWAWEGLGRAWRWNSESVLQVKDLGQAASQDPELYDPLGARVVVVDVSAMMPDPAETERDLTECDGQNATQRHLPKLTLAT